ncbi:transferase [Gilbertella persicaria]|uniref:transferase n=1 Tax=Gilbertella persicaria TaxID=101096 RepID=UPI00221EAC56|nr:transferase [Gilbertella persicaria]KAI8080149.1 transferase [Gilbertella persicaria]
MVPLPPKHRSFITSRSGLTSDPISAPHGFSLVTSHIYTQVLYFFENIHHDPSFMNSAKIKEALRLALEIYYPFTGRLIKKENGRYDIGHFDKGALFEVVDSADDFEYWKRHNFSYLIVPYEELLPIKSYVSRDSPLFGVKLTVTKSGSCAIAYSIHHKIADGICLTRLIAYICAITRGEMPSQQNRSLYTDSMRLPVQPLPDVDHNDMYPHYLPGQAPVPTIKPAPSKKLIFNFDRQLMSKFKSQVVAEANDPKARISLFNLLTALVHKSITKARQRPSESCSDLVCIVGQHHCHPDKNMMNYFGNFIVPVPVPFTVQQVIDKSTYQIAKEIGIACKSITVPYMESLEYYFNTSKHLEHIVSPISRLGYGGVGISDWSRFLVDFDYGYGHYVAMRSFVDTSPIPLITIMPYKPDRIEVIIQLDVKSLDRLLQDKELMQFVKCVN